MKTTLLRFLLLSLVPLAAVATLPCALAAPKAAPLPVGPDGRAVYRLAELIDVDDLAVSQLIDLGFLLERQSDGVVIAWLSPEGMGKLEALGIAWKEIPDPALEAMQRDTLSEALDYHNHAELTSALQQIANDHPQITRLISAGNSVEGRELWWLKISDNPDTEENEPGFKYISTMHGDEPVGTEMCLQLIHYLTDGYGTDPRATRLVDETEIWIMPMMNPDGNAHSQRTNANGVDLNRNFPDFWDDPDNTTAGRAVETTLIMNWAATNSTTLSANYHTGALVVNYPFDNNENGSSTDSPTPDDDIVREISLEYSEDNGPMYNGSFSQGITNGADWYVISGGMQDWNYNYEGDIEVTVELSNSKWPAASQLEGLWQDNKESMISYMERVLTGVRGIVTNAENSAPVAARLSLVGRDHSFFTDPEVGNYQRCLPAGSFNMLVEADGYESRTVPLTITDSAADATVVNVQLTPLPTTLEYESQRLADDANSNNWLEAGEAGHLALTLKNLGDSATGINGTLRPLSPHAQAPGSGSWPDLGAGQSGESNPPHFAISAAADTPPGHKLSFAADWETSEGDRGTTKAFFVPVGVPSTSQEASTDVPKDILDNSTINSLLEITTDRQIREINVHVDITHSYQGDLSVTLIAPDATEVRLHDKSGGSANDILTWYDTETPSVDPLDLLVDKASLGTWTLRVEDSAGGDEGSLNAWTLEVIGSPWEDPLAAVLLRKVSILDGGQVQLDWWPSSSATSYRVYRSLDASSEAAFSDVSSEDADPTDTRFQDSSGGSMLYWLVSGEGHTGEGLWDHFGH